jgi:hypothetical protein
MRDRRMAVIATWDIIMTTNTELELRALQAHELDLASGGGIPVHQPFTNAAEGAKGDFSKYENWGILEPVNSPLNVSLWVGKLGGIR